MPMKYFDTKTHGEVLSRITNDIDTLSQSLNQSMTQLINICNNDNWCINNDVIYKLANDSCCFTNVTIINGTNNGYS